MRVGEEIRKNLAGNECSDSHPTAGNDRKGPECGTEGPPGGVRVA